MSRKMAVVNESPQPLTDTPRKPSAFAGKRALGCITYLKPQHEIVLYAIGSIEQKWSQDTPLMIVAIDWDAEAKARAYTLRDSGMTLRTVPESHLKEAIS